MKEGASQVEAIVSALNENGATLEKAIGLVSRQNERERVGSELH